MKRLFHIALAALLPLSGCYKDEVDIAALNNNPFDPAYEGSPVFVMVDTYTEIVNIGVGNVLYQVMEFRVNEQLFLSPASYSVQVHDLQSGVTELMNPDPPGGSTFKFYRQPAPGQSICLEVRLSNNQSVAGPETICATL